MAYIPQQDSIVSSVNSSTTLLTSGSVFTGTGEDCSDYAAISLNVLSSVTGTVNIQFSSDNTNWDVDNIYDVSASVGFSINETVVANYYRVVFTNGSSTQTAFRLQAIIHKNKAEPDARFGFYSDLNSTTTALIASAVYTGSTEEVTNYASISITAKSDVVGVLSLEQSCDGTNWDISENFDIKAGIVRHFTMSVSARYMRVIITNDTTAQSYLRVCTILHKAKTDNIARDPNIEIAIGNVPDFRQLNIIGNTTSLGTTYTDIWDDNSLFTEPTGNESYEVLSTSALDTSGGTGAQGVRITGLDASGLETFVDLLLNGTTAVAVTGTFSFPRQCIVGLSGSGKTNAGTITVQVAGGGAKRLVIPVDEGKTSSSIVKLPSDATAFITSLTFVGTAGKDVTIRTRLLNAGTNTWVTISTVPFDGSPIVIPVQPEIEIPASSLLKTQAKVVSSTTANITTFIQLRLRNL